MERRDILQEQIERIGKVINNALALLSGKGTTMDPIILDSAVRNLKEELDWDIADTLQMSVEELQDYISQRSLTADHLELLAKLYIRKGEWTLLKDKQKRHYQKAIELLTLADQKAEEFSWNRMNMRNRLAALL